MDISHVKAEMIRLRKEIKRHNRKYYELDAPEISDYEYDKLMTRLNELEAAYPEFITPTSPTQTVGGAARREAGKLVAHDVPMLSLQDVFNRGDVENFVNDVLEKLGEVEFVVEEKIDGLSLALRYVDGKFVQAVTRGDGIHQGEDVTENARVIDDVIQQLVDVPELKPVDVPELELVLVPVPEVEPEPEVEVELEVEAEPALLLEDERIPSAASLDAAELAAASLSTCSCLSFARCSAAAFLAASSTASCFSASACSAASWARLALRSSMAFISAWCLPSM